MKLIFAQVGVERLDWFGFGVASANRTAAFIACLIVASWIFAAIFKKTGFWISIILSLVLYYFLVQTQSRGAFVFFFQSNLAA
jgi:predicted membrane protein